MSQRALVRFALLRLRAQLVNKHGPALHVSALSSLRSVLPFIDHCMQCAPRWGVKGAPVKVR